MKTLKIKLIAFGVTLLLMSMVFLAHADNTEENSDLETMKYLESYFESAEMNARSENNLTAAMQIKIYNSSNELIIAGSENEDKIKKYVPLSDLLTEFDGTKYFRLSYK